jgi:hypothetical protein
MTSDRSTGYWVVRCCGMKALRTKTCRRHGHPEFRISYDPAVVVVPEDVKWLLGWLEKTVADGTRYTPGQTCQVGWMVTEVRQHEDGELSIWEPDMRHLPIEWADSVSYTLAHLRAQKDVVESVLGADDMTLPSIRQSAIMCTRLGRDEGMVLERVAPSGADSGWFCGCSDEDHDHNDVAELRRVSLYEAAVRHAPQIVPYLALPAGVLVGIEAGKPVVFRDGKSLAFRSGSYLARRNADA